MSALATAVAQERGEQATRAHRLRGGHWIIVFVAGEVAWELEVPVGAIPGLPVRLHLVESGSQRGVVASAQVPWRVYREAIATLTGGAPGCAGRVLSQLIRVGFGPLAIALAR